MKLVDRAGTAAPWLLLCVVLAVQLVGLSPELTSGRADLNDNVLHYTIVERMAQAVESGENPLDCWVSEFALGYPVPRTYQPLGHALVVALYFLFGKAVSLAALFAWVRYLAIALLPLTFFCTARLLCLPPATAAAAALVAPLVSTPGLMGIEYGSFVWGGSGLYPQSVAVHLILLAIGISFRALRRGRGLALAGVLLALTFLAHFLYGYMAALTVCLMAVLPDEKTPRALRWSRVAWIGGVALAVAAFQLAPLIGDSALINHSKWEPDWKWESFGARQVFAWLFTGRLLDSGRWPVLSLLAAGGAVLAWRRRRLAPHALLLGGAAFWLLLFCGRPLWGPLLALIGVSSSMQIHRFLGGAHVFLVLLAATALAALWTMLWRNWRAAGLVIGTALILYPMVQERGRYLAWNRSAGLRNFEAVAAERKLFESTAGLIRERGGRVYAGLAGNWGSRFKVGEVPVYGLLGPARLPAVSFLYHAMAPAGDLMVRFTEWNPAHYRLFNVRSVLAETSSLGFLRPVGQHGRLAVFDAPGQGYFDLVDVPWAAAATSHNFFDVNDRWMNGEWVANGQYLGLDRAGEFPGVPRLAPDAVLPAVSAASPAGQVLGERRAGEFYSANVAAARACYVLFRMGWHPNWRATVDGRPARAVPVSPGFAAVRVDAGAHRVEFRYRPEGWRTALMWFALVAGLALPVAERFRPLAGAAWRVRIRWPALLVALCLPACAGMATGRLPLAHDAAEYFPRLIEFHENIAHGILAPRWAPDLSRGNGQPLFAFNPPAVYYLGEFWYLAGCSPVTSMNLAAATLALAAAFGMFLLARLYFGDAGAWLAAAAYVYAPYFAVDLYVRFALAEFAAFPFYAFSLYGFGAWATSRRRTHLALGAAAYGGVLLSHHAAALMFTPLLITFVTFTAWRQKSWPVLWTQLAGVALGLALGASAWLPGLLEAKYASLDRLLTGALHYSQHFVYLHQLVWSPWGYGTSGPGYPDGMSFALGWSHLALAAAAGFALRRRGGEECALFRFFAAAAAVFCALTLTDAVWLWEHAPLMPYLQFPWRFLGPAALCLSMSIAPLGRALSPLAGWRAAAFAAAMALLVVPNLAHLTPRGYEDIDMSFWTPRQIAERGFEPTTAMEYAPRIMKSVPQYDTRPARVIVGDGRITAGERTPEAWSGTIAAATECTLELPIVFFPGWRASVDGRDAAITPAVETGLVWLRMPPGAHTVEVQFTRTAPRLVGDGLTLAALAALAWLLRRTSGSPA